MFQSLKNRWGFDANEIAVLNSSFNAKQNKNQSKATRKIIIQAPVDYYILSLHIQVMHALQKSYNLEVIALWPNMFTLKQKFDFIHPLRLLYSQINFLLTKIKWTKLYKSVGVSSIYYLDSVSVQKKLIFGVQAFKLWKGLRSKEDLIKLSINNIYCGDLIYDTYLRYRIKPTVSITNINLLYYIYKCICAIESSEKLVKENTISDYFSSYSTYIQHGIPVRVFLKHGINVYTSGNFQQRFKKLTVKDHYHSAAYKDYQQHFKTLDNQDEKLLMGKQLLTNKFKGVIDKASSYMKKSAYQNVDTADNFDLSFDGIVFLHDFYDSPHIYSSMLFPDFYEWVEHTLKLIIKHDLNIGVKPHPNQVSDSKKDIDKLQRKYPSIKWIDPKTSNLKILNSGIKFGVSIYGTVLHELAFHGVNPICAGDNPHSSFNFVHFPQSVDEYDDMIINNLNLKLPENYLDQVSCFYYMHNIHNKEDLQINTDLFNNYNILNGSSELVLKVVSSINNCDN